MERKSQDKQCAVHMHLLEGGDLTARRFFWFYFLLCPKKVARGHTHNSRGKWPPPGTKWQSLSGVVDEEQPCGYARSKSYIVIYSFKSDQHQLSPHDINAKSRLKVMRIKEMIIERKMLWFFFKELRKWSLKGKCFDFFYQILSTNSLKKHLVLVWRFCMWILGLKGLNIIY